jgi:uncharacterized protein (TIGR02996 family)
MLARRLTPREDTFDAEGSGFVLGQLQSTRETIMWPDCASDPTGLSLLQGAREHPHDTDRLLILADWLEEQDEPEAADCVCESLQDPDRWVYFDESIRARWHPWNGCQQGWPGVYCSVVPMVSSHPWLCALKMDGRSVGPSEATYLASLPILRHLTYLSLACNEIDNRGVQALADSPHLTHLTVLRLPANAIGPTGAQALANSPGLANLTTLNLSSNPIGDEGARSLAGSRYLTNLAELSLNTTSLGDEGVQALASSPILANLTTLNLYSNAIGPAGAQALASSATLGRLRFLALGHNNRLGDDGFQALVTSPYLTGLTHLYLTDNPFSDYDRLGPRGAEALPTSTLTGLTHLSLTGANLGPAGAASLATSPALRNLKVLNLSYNRIRFRGVDALARSPYLGNLEILDLSGNDVGDAGVRALAASAFPNLTTLILGEALGPTAICALADAPGLPSLQFLRLGMVRVRLRDPIALRLFLAEQEEETR